MLLEGLEVAVIVITFSAARAGSFLWAAAGALAAGALVAIAAVLLRRPFSRVPENAMGFIVGIMLLSFGTFWSGEGLRAALGGPVRRHWRGSSVSMSSRRLRWCASLRAAGARVKQAYKFIAGNSRVTPVGIALAIALALGLQHGHRLVERAALCVRLLVTLAAATREPVQ